MNDDEDDVVFMVVVNDELQYSIWPVGRPVPSGWRSVGFEAVKALCLDHIDRIWTDMRPLSLRQAMEQHAPDGAHATASDTEP